MRRTLSLNDARLSAGQDYPAHLVHERLSHWLQSLLSCDVQSCHVCRSIMCNRKLVKEYGRSVQSHAVLWESFQRAPARCRIANDRSPKMRKGASTVPLPLCSWAVGTLRGADIAHITEANRCAVCPHHLVERAITRQLSLPLRGTQHATGRQNNSKK